MKDVRRDLKFRAWNPSSKSMIYPHEDELDIFNFFGVSFGGKIVGSQMGDLQERPDLIGMQYTGLKDSKGVEIYESDILRNNFWVEPKLQLYICKWNMFGAQFEMHSVHGNTIEEFDGDYMDLSIWTIIGNVHQHPELLKEG